MKKTKAKGKDLIDQIDALHLRGALVALNSLLLKMPDTRRFNAAGHRVCENACNARNALRALLAEHDMGEITAAALGSPSPRLTLSQSGKEVAA
jgi:hypothetical protein